MNRTRIAALPAVFALLLASCDGGDAASDKAASPEPSNTAIVAGADDTQAYAGIAENELVHFTGTEPFWSGEVSGGTLTYITPENQAGEMVAVSRFAGRNGISYSGQLGAEAFVLAVTPGRCSDGMSDRAYPFVVTLKVKGDLRNGCAWTDKQPFTGSQHP